MSALWTSLVAVTGTLAGGVLTGALHIRTARTDRREARRDARQGDVLAAVTALVAALADHRRAMWVLEDVRLAEVDSQAVADAVAAHHVTRSAVTAPLTTVSLLAPTLADPAREAAKATYAMRGAADAGDGAVLEARRAVALAASDHLVGAAAEFLAVGGAR